MSHARLATFFFAGVATLVAPAQSEEPNAIQFDSVRLTLGMRQAEVFASLAPAYEARGEGDSYVIVRKQSATKVGVASDQGASAGVVGSAGFKGGRLVSLAKDWSLRDQGEGSALARSLHGAVAGFGAKQSGCNVNTYTTEVQAPHGADVMKGIRITCGRKTVEMTIHSTQGKEFVVVGDSLQ
jgi:hypothetical protein